MAAYQPAFAAGSGLMDVYIEEGFLCKEWPRVTAESGKSEFIVGQQAHAWGELTASCQSRGRQSAGECFSYSPENESL